MGFITDRFAAMASEAAPPSELSRGLERGPSCIDCGAGQPDGVHGGRDLPAKGGMAWRTVIYGGQCT